MGLTAIPFAVDIDKVKSVFGSKDRELLERIKTADLYDHYANQTEDFLDPVYQYNFDYALEDIIFRYKKPVDRKPESRFFGLVKSKPTSGLSNKIAHAYGYVLLVICGYIGTHLLPHCDGFYYGQSFKAAEKILKKNGLTLDLDDMFEQHEVFDIPYNSDFPAIKLFTKQAIEHLNEVMTKVEIDENKTDFNSDDFDEVQEMLRNIKDSFQICKEKNLEMVTFTH